MVASEVGEETLLICDKCGYRANSEKAEYRRTGPVVPVSKEELKEVHTPDIKTIDDLTAFFKCEQDSFLKSIIYVADGKPVMVVVPGSREINENKLGNYLAAINLELGSDSVVEDVTGAPVGFAGPVTDKNIRMIFDVSVKNTFNAITGANKKDYHYSGVNPGRDFNIKEETDLTSARAGDSCIKCGTEMYEKKGIEVGHIFKLGYKYTEAMKVSVLDEKGSAITPIMGCYGIGVNRTMAAAVEQNNDERGIIWPKEITPFQVHLIGIAKSDQEIAAVEGIYEKMTDAGIEVLYDDRKASPGFKFADADLIGIPLRITAGKGFFSSGELELKERGKKEVVNIPADRIVDEIWKYYK
jgi:prolyl-tRNA synthetase